jgi:iron complex outermembrane receptor protein
LYATKNTFGNKNLVPEEAVIGEIGSKFITPGIKIHNAVFLKNSNNIIDWVQIYADSTWKIINNVTTDEDTIWFAQNISNFQTVGFEVAININFHDLLNKNIFINSIGMNYSYLSINKSSEEYTSKYALDNLKHNFNFKLNHKIFKNYLSASWKITYHNREGTITINNNQVSYNPFWLIDSRLNFHRKYLTLYLEGSNLLNSVYYELGNEPQPGRWFLIGLTMSK